MIQTNKYYFVGEALIKVIHASSAIDEIIIMNYDDQAMQITNFHAAKLTFKPAFKIGEVGRMLDRKPDTIRKWELHGLIPEQRQWQIGDKKSLRFYSLKDVATIRDLVSSIHVGRPRKDKRTTSDIPPAGEIKKLLRERIKQINV